MGFTVTSSKFCRIFGAFASCGVMVSVPALSAETPAASAGLSVSAKPVRKMCFEDHVDVTGTVVPRHEVAIGPDREGLQVSQVLVEPLDTVTPGQVLARLTSMDAQGAAGPAVPIRSSVAGIVEQVSARSGTPATMRQPLFEIIVGGDLDLQAELPSGDLARIAVGQPVTITPLGMAALSGSIGTIDTRINPTSQLGRLRITVTGASRLRVGTFARGLIVVARRCGLGIPFSSVIYPPDGTVVQALASNRVETRRVTVGLLSGTDVEILSGLKDGDVVVTRAAAFLRDGDEVHPILVRDQHDPETK